MILSEIVPGSFWGHMDKRVLYRKESLTWIKRDEGDKRVLYGKIFGSFFAKRLRMA